MGPWIICCIFPVPETQEDKHEYKDKDIDSEIPRAAQALEATRVLKKFALFVGGETDIDNFLERERKLEHIINSRERRQSKIIEFFKKIKD